MKKTEVIAFFGSQEATGEALGITQAAVSQWPSVVPITRQYQIEVITRGKLKVEQASKDALSGAVQ